MVELRSGVESVTTKFIYILSINDFTYHGEIDVGGVELHVDLFVD